MQIKGYKAGISKAECSCKANIKPSQLELYWGALSYLRTIIHFFRTYLQRFTQRKKICIFGYKQTQVKYMLLKVKKRY